VTSTTPLIKMTFMNVSIIPITESALLSCIVREYGIYFEPLIGRGDASKDAFETVLYGTNEPSAVDESSK
jgi:hypothetical protein